MSSADLWKLRGQSFLDEETELIVPGSLAEIFEEEPVDLKTFVTDRKYLGANWYLSDIQEEAVRHIERVYLPDLYPRMAEEFDSDYWADPIPMKNILTLQWGKGSGKDHVCRVASLRVAYLLLCLRSPQRYFGMPEHDSIHMLNIAVNAAQAERAYFKPLTQAVKRGWFADKASPKRDTIEYAKNLTAISGHSDAESQEGLNLILGIADEIDAFREQSEMIGLGNRKREASTSAESILKMLKGSASTRFPYSYKRVAISYPRYVGSTIQQQTEEAYADIERVGNEKSIYFASGPHATWEVNPLRKGKEDFAADYEKDPIEAASMYECRPARAIDGYFTNIPAIRQCVTEPNQPITVEYALEPARSEYNGEVVNIWNAKFHIADSFRPKQGARYAMHADLALTGDRAGIAMSHIERWEDRVEYIPDEATGTMVETMVRVPYIRNDFVVSFEASKKTTPPREIQIRWARELCFALVRRGFHIVLFSFDQFQSADSMQILNNHGIETERISADINDAPYKTLRDVAYESRLTLPNSDKLFDELAQLNRTGKGKVDHPPGGCFVGETRIPLLDGTYPQISELAGQQVWVYSADSDGKIKPGLARGRMTKSTTSLVDVILDNGYVARCTPEHLWMLRDGSYKEAQALRPGIDRLMPITFNWPVNGGYTRVTDKDGLRTLGHHMVAEHYYGRSRREDEVVHHKNEVKTDNRPENLEIVSQRAHVTHHSTEVWSDKEELMRAGHRRWASDPTRKAAAYADRSMPFVRSDITLDTILGAVRQGAKNRAEAARLLDCDWNVVNSRLKVEGMAFEDLLQLVDNNHKVRAVIRVELEEPVPVYDLEVDEFHNFALSGGVFVHNSKDLSDALACSIVGAIASYGEETVDGKEVAIAAERFAVGPALAPLEGMSNRPLKSMMPVGMEGMKLYG